MARGRAWWLGIAAAAGAAALALSGCTSAQLVNVWQDPSFSGHRVRGVLVVAQRQDQALRRLWEDAVRAQLLKGGVNAVASYEMFPDGPPTRSQVRQALGDRGLDAAMIVRPMPPSYESSWVPGWNSVQQRVYYDPWRGEDRVVVRERYHHGYRVVERYDREQVTLWSGGEDDRMVWAGTALMPSNPQDRVAHDLATGVVPVMKKSGMI
jgi:hypothetical protein